MLLLLANSCCLLRSLCCCWYYYNTDVAGVLFRDLLFDHLNIENSVDQNKLRWAFILACKIPHWSESRKTVFPEQTWIMLKKQKKNCKHTKRNAARESGEKFIHITFPLFPPMKFMCDRLFYPNSFQFFFRLDYWCPWMYCIISPIMTYLVKEELMDELKCINIHVLLYIFVRVIFFATFPTVFFKWIRIYIKFYFLAHSLYSVDLFFWQYSIFTLPFFPLEPL